MSSQIRRRSLSALVATLAFLPSAVGAQGVYRIDPNPRSIQVQHNIDLAKLPNSLFHLANPKLQQARDYLLQARDALKDPKRIARNTSSEAAAERLRQSAHLVELVLVSSF